MWDSGEKHPKSAVFIKKIKSGNHTKAKQAEQRERGPIVPNSEYLIDQNFKSSFNFKKQYQSYIRQYKVSVSENLKKLRYHRENLIKNDINTCGQQRLLFLIKQKAENKKRIRSQFCG